MTTALMLNGAGHVSRFLSNVSVRLGFSLENVYATNACKNFFKETPTQIKKKSGINVIGLSNPLWLPVLREELAWFPNAAVITLGEPVLQGLVRPGFSQDVKSYWGYRKGWSRKGFESFRPVVSEQTVIDRMFFPFVHLNTSRKSKSVKFYEARFHDYIDFVRTQIGQETHAWES